MLLVFLCCVPVDSDAAVDALSAALSRVGVKDKARVAVLASTAASRPASRPRAFEVLAAALEPDAVTHSSLRSAVLETVAPPHSSSRSVAGASGDEPRGEQGPRHGGADYCSHHWKDASTEGDKGRYASEEVAPAVKKHRPD